MPKSYKIIRKAKPAVSPRRHRVTYQNTDLPPQALQVLPYDKDEGGEGGRGEPRIRDLLGAPQDETTRMYNEQRVLEQAGHRRLGKVNTRERADELPVGGQQMSEGYQAHPLLSNLQRFDGVDPKVNPMAVIASQDPLIANELEKEIAKQEHDKQLRLSLQKEKNHTHSNRSTPTLSR